MKWFKHISDSLDDPFIFDLMTQYGPSGYLIFFGILEIYAREFKPDPGWKLEASLTYLRSKLRLTHGQVLTKCLRTIFEARKWDIEIGQKSVVLFIPKFHEMIDEYSRKQGRKSPDNIRTRSGHAPDNVAQEQETEQDKDKELKTNTVVNDLKPGGNGGDEKAVFYKKLKKVLGQIQEVYPDPFFNQQIILFIQSNTKRNPDALVHCLESILKAPEIIKHPKAYLEAAMKIQDGKFNAAESERISNDHKTAPINLGALIEGIGKRI